MRRNLNKIVDDYIASSDHRDLIIETEALIKDTPETIIRLIDLLNCATIEATWKRKQLLERFLSFLLKLEEDTQISITYEVVRKYLEQVNIKELADKLSFFASSDKLIRQILKTKNEQDLKAFNRLVIGSLLLRATTFDADEKLEFTESFSAFDFDWCGLDLSEVEKGITLRSYSLNGGGFGFSFGLQSEQRFPYALSDFGSLGLNVNSNQSLIDLSSTIANDYIRLVEIGEFECVEEEIHDLEAGIICQLSYGEGEAEVTNIAFRAISGKTVFEYLFGMSVLGGAYERGDYGATSRINAWKVICGLTQSDYYQSSKAEIEKTLHQFRWTEFSCENEWFINEWIDLGIIGINEIEKKYAVLVISDTD